MSQFVLQPLGPYSLMASATFLEGFAPAAYDGGEMAGHLHLASVASRLHPFSGTELCPTDLTRWRALRSELDHRYEARRMQYRFRQSPEKYLTVLEEKLMKERLPS